MNKYDQAFSIGGLELFTAMIGQKNNMRVVFGGDKTCIDHSTTPMTIYFPGDLANTHENRLIIEAKAGHEAAHGRFTDFDAFVASSWPLFVNLLEDPRIERLMGKRYIGFKQVFKQRWQVMRHTLSWPKQDDGLMQNLFHLLWYGMRFHILDHPVGDFAKAAETLVRQRIPADIVDQILELSRSAASGDSTQHVCDCVDAMMKLLLEPQDETPEQEACDDGVSSESQDADQRDTDSASSQDTSSDVDSDMSAEQPGESDQSESRSDDSTDTTADDTDSRDSPSNIEGGSTDDSTDSDSSTDAVTADGGDNQSDKDDANKEKDASVSDSGEDSSIGSIESSDNGTDAQASGDSYSRSSDQDDWQSLLQASKDQLEAIDEDELMDQLLERDAYKEDRVNEKTMDQLIAYAIDETHSRRITNQLRSQLMGLLQAMAINEEYHVSSGGQLDQRRLHTLCTPNPKPFIRLDEGEVLDTAIQFLIDGSSSMSRDNRIGVANEAAYALAQATHSIDGVVSATAYFQDDYVVAVNRFEDKPNARHFGIRQNGCTPMAMALHWSLFQLWPRSEARKIVIFLTDGYVGDDTVRKIAFLTKHGIECYGIGLGADLSHILPMSKQASIKKVDDLPRAMFGVLRKALFNQ